MWITGPIFPDMFFLSFQQGKKTDKFLSFVEVAVNGTVLGESEKKENHPTEHYVDYDFSCTFHLQNDTQALSDITHKPIICETSVMQITAEQNSMLYWYFRHFILIKFWFHSFLIIGVIISSWCITQRLYTSWHTSILPNTDKTGLDAIIYYIHILEFIRLTCCHFKYNTVILIIQNIWMYLMFLITALFQNSLLIGSLLKN